MADIDVNSLEPNSHKYKAEKANGGNKKEPGSREKVSPIVKRDQVVSTKKPLGKKFAETFMTEDARDVKSWLLMDVIIPGVKNTILDILSMMFFGEVDNRRRGRKRRDDDRRDYSSYYSGGSSSSRDRRDSRRRRDDSYYDSDDRVDFRNIVLRNRDDAEDLIEEMQSPTMESMMQELSGIEAEQAMQGVTSDGNTETIMQTLSDIQAEIELLKA